MRSKQQRLTVIPLKKTTGPHGEEILTGSDTMVLDRSHFFWIPVSVGFVANLFGQKTAARRRSQLKRAPVKTNDAIAATKKVPLGRKVKGQKGKDPSTQGRPH